MEAEHAVIGLAETAIVNVHLVGCAAYHLSLPHQGLIGQQLWPHPSVSKDGQRLLFREVHLSHLETEQKGCIENTEVILVKGSLLTFENQNRIGLGNLLQIYRWALQLFIKDITSNKLLHRYYPIATKYIYWLKLFIFTIYSAFYPKLVRVNAYF